MRCASAVTRAGCTQLEAAARVDSEAHEGKCVLRRCGGAWGCACARDSGHVRDTPRMDARPAPSDRRIRASVHGQRSRGPGTWVFISKMHGIS